MPGSKLCFLSFVLGPFKLSFDLERTKSGIRAAIKFAWLFAWRLEGLVALVRDGIAELRPVSPLKFFRSLLYLG